MPFLVRATEFNPPTRPHRGFFNFKVTHVGYGETRKEKGVVKAYSMKSGHPNCTLPGARLKSFTSLDNNTSLIWVTKSSDVDIPYAVPKYRMDGETCRYWSAHPNKCLWASARPPQPSIRHSNFGCVNRGREVCCVVFVFKFPKTATANLFANGCKTSKKVHLRYSMSFRSLFTNGKIWIDSSS